MIILGKSKNYIMNGAFDFYQRGSSYANAKTAVWVADRFAYQSNLNTSLPASSISNSDIPTLSQSLFSFSNSLALSTASSQTIASSEYSYLEQRIEGRIFSPLTKRKITLSFWVKSNVVGTYAVSFRNNNQDKSYVATYTINNASTWENKSITFTHDNAGSWSSDESTGLRVSFVLAAGSNYSTTANSWVDGNKLNTSSCVNLFSIASSSFKITGVQLEEGIETSNFERFGGTYSSEYNACLRYYESGYPLMIGRCSSTTAMTIGSIYFKIPKKSATSTITISNGVDHNSLACTLGSYTTSTNVANLNIAGTGWVAATPGFAWFQWFADSELT